MSIRAGDVGAAPALAPDGGRANEPFPASFRLECLYGRPGHVMNLRGKPRHKLSSGIGTFIDAR